MRTLSGSSTLSKLSPRKNGPCSAVACPLHTCRPRPTHSGPTMVVRAAQRTGRRGPDCPCACMQRLHGPRGWRARSTSVTSSRPTHASSCMQRCRGPHRWQAQAREVFELAPCLMELECAGFELIALVLDGGELGAATWCQMSTSRSCWRRSRQRISIQTNTDGGCAGCCVIGRHTKTQRRRCCEYGPYGGMYQCCRATPHHLHAQGNCNIAVPAAWRC
jgi:hypothetical protein